MADENSKAYVPQSGMTPDHVTKVQDTAKAEGVIVVIRNTNLASTKLIEKGCPGNRSLLSVCIQAGLNQQDAMDRRRNEPKLLRGPADGWRTYEEYAWLEPRQ